MPHMYSILESADNRWTPRHELNCGVNLLELGLESPLDSNTPHSIFLQYHSSQVVYKMIQHYRVGKTQLWLLHCLGCKFPRTNNFMLAVQIYH